MKINKKTGIILILIFVFIFVFINQTLKQQKSDEKPINTYPENLYKELTIGKSTEEEVVNKFGIPIKQKEINSDKVLEFKSNNINYNDEFFINNNKLTFIKKIISPKDNISITSLNEQYGIHTNILYGNRSQSGFNLYVIPEKGVAYIGNQKLDELLEIWYFQATDFKTFKQLYGSGYRDSINSTQDQL